MLVSVGIDDSIADLKRPELIVQPLASVSSPVTQH